MKKTTKILFIQITIFSQSYGQIDPVVVTEQTIKVNKEKNSTSIWPLEMRLFVIWMLKKSNILKNLKLLNILKMNI